MFVLMILLTYARDLSLIDKARLTISVKIYPATFPRTLAVTRIFIQIS